MVHRFWNAAIEQAGLLALDERPDTELLTRFLADRGGPAFAAVLRRHGPLVWGICRNLLPAEADAEDAFQATFLALAQGASRICKPTALGTWLHGNQIGDSYLLLTDANGVQESFTIRVK